MTHKIVAFSATVQYSPPPHRSLLSARSIGMPLYYVWHICGYFLNILRTYRSGFHLLCASYAVDFQ